MIGRITKINFALLVLSSLLLSMATACSDSANVAKSNVSTTTNTANRSSTTTSSSDRYEKGASKAYEKGATITFQEEGKPSLVVTFDEGEMRTLSNRVRSGNPGAGSQYVWAKLEALGKKCCEPRKRINDCVWQCCDKSTVTTCDPLLQHVFESESYGSPTKRFRE